MSITLDELIKLAPTIFTATTVLIGIALLLLLATWKNYKEVSGSWPSKRRGIKNAYLLTFLEIGCILIAFSIFFNILALGVVVSIMLKIELGPLQLHNLYESRYVALVGYFLFAFGLYFIGVVKFIEALHWFRDKTNPLVFTPTPAQDELPTPRELPVSESNQASEPCADSSTEQKEGNKER